MSYKYEKEGPINNCMSAVGKCVYWCAENRWQKRTTEAAKIIGPLEIHINNLKVMLDDYLSSSKEEFAEELRALEQEKTKKAVPTTNEPVVLVNPLLVSPPLVEGVGIEDSDWVDDSWVDYWSWGRDLLWFEYYDSKTSKG